jgi:hypothetical protein
MRKTTFLVGGIALLTVLAAAACSPAAQPASAPANQPAAAAPAVALCQNPTTCQAPDVVLHQIDCANKIPYTNVLVPAGTKFEVLDKSGDFTCKDSGKVVDGKTVLICYGKELYSFNLKLTNSACGGAALTTGTGQCQQGYGYDAAQKCCAPVAGDQAGSTTVQVDLGACPLPRVVLP